MTMLRLGGWEILIIAAVILLLFGAKKIPELMKNMGKGVKSFKQGMKEAEEAMKDDSADKKDEPKADN